MALVTQNLSKELLKALPAMSRASFDVAPVLYAAGSGDESGAELTTDVRDELLRKCAAGEYVAVDIDVLAYEQRDGVRNRNNVRFRNESLIALGASGKGKPFLKDHEQWDSMSVAGKIITSKTTKLAEGQYEMRMRVRLTAPWAVELALRGLLFAVSIGWEAEGPIECSTCGTAIYTKCYHWPGDRVTEMPQADGTKKFVWDRNGVNVVEWIYTKAALKECSICPIGGVKLAGVEGVRAALAAGIPDEELRLRAELLGLDQDNSTRTEVVPQPALTNEGSMADNKLLLAVLSAAHFAHYQTLSPMDAEAFAQKPVAERDSILTAALNADPVVHTCKDGTVIRKSAGELALKQAKQLDAQAEQLAANAAALALANEKSLTETLRARTKLELGHLAGSDDVKLAALRAVESIADEKLRGEVITMLKSADAAMAELGGTPKGAGGDDAPAKAANMESAFAALSSGLSAYCAANKIDDTWTAGLAAYKKTTEGKSLADAYTAFTK